MGKISFGFLLLVAVMLLPACNNDSLVGGEIVDGDGIQVNYTDTISLVATTIPGEDSLVTRSSNSSVVKLFLGEMEDPFFGKQTYKAYFQPVLNVSRPNFFVNNNYINIDSVVLFAELDTANIYGNPSATHTLNVYQLDEKLQSDKTYYTSEELTNGQVISENVVIHPSKENQSLIFGQDTFSMRPSIRVRLDNEFFQTMIDDSLNYTDNDAFTNYIKGISLESATDNSVLPINVGVNYGASNPVNKIAIFYTDTIPKIYFLPITGVRHQYVDHDYSGAPVEMALNNSTPADDYYYLQGFNGTDVKVTLPQSNFENWGNVIIKKAELEVYCVQDEEPYTAISGLILDTDDDEGNRELVVDALRIAEAGVDFENVFGGVIEEVEENSVITKKYTFNITEYFANLIEENSIESDTLYINSRSPLNVPERSIILGPNHPEHPMKIKVLYSLPK